MSLIAFLSCLPFFDICFCFNVILFPDFLPEKEINFVLASIFKWSIMVYLKEFQRDSKLFLSVVDKEDDRFQLGRSFWVHRYLRRPKANQSLAIQPFSFPPKLWIWVGKGKEDDSVWYFFQSMYHNKSNFITKFPMLGQHIISRHSIWGPNMLLYG